MTAQVTLIRMKTYLEKLLLNWISSTVQYPESHRYTWIDMRKSIAHKQQEYLTDSKRWLWCLCFHIPRFDSRQSSTLSYYTHFPLSPYSQYVPLFFTFSPLTLHKLDLFL